MPRSQPPPPAPSRSLERLEAEAELCRRALSAAATILQSGGGRYAHLLKPGDSLLVDGPRLLAEKLDEVIDNARRVLHLDERLAAGQKVDTHVLEEARAALRRSLGPGS